MNRIEEMIRYAYQMLLLGLFCIVMALVFEKNELSLLVGISGFIMLIMGVALLGKGRKEQKEEKNKEE